MTSRPAATALLRVLRAGLLAAVAVGLGTVGHTLVSEAAPPTVAIAFLAVVLGTFAWLGAGREWRARTIVLVLAAGQGLTHVAAMAAADPHGIHSAAGNPLLLHLQGTPLAGAHGAGGALRLLAVHAVATLLCALWLRSGEKRAWRWLRASLAVVGRVLLRGSGPPLAALACLLPAAPRRSDRIVPACSLPAAGRGWSRRGPPALTCSPA